jgi:crossover junction endodeoxyribonuclease RusA
MTPAEPATDIHGAHGHPETALSVFVPGQPAPQGSKRYVGHGRMIESSRALPAWREAVRWTAVNAWAQRPPLTGAVVLSLAFVLRRPASTPKRRTPAATKKPDASKLLRAVEDALTDAGVWRDDSLVIELHVTKRLAECDEAPGCHIRIQSAEDV